MHPIRNFCIVEIAQGYTSLDTELRLIANDGLKLPDPEAEGKYNLVWFNFTDYKNPSDDPYREIIQVTKKTGDTLTVIRGREEIAASAKNLTGKTYKFILTMTKASYDEIVPGRHGKISNISDGNPDPNALGDNSVDFQFQRSNANQSSRGTNSFTAGASNTASGGGSFAVNIGNTSSGLNSAAFGSDNTASGDQSFVIGENNIASAENSAALGEGSKARLKCQVTHANASNGAAGDAQSSRIILKASTTNDTPKDMYLNLYGGADGIILLENNTSYLFKGLILGRQADVMSVGYEIKGLITRGANAAATELQGNVTVDRICDMSLGCDVIVSADTSNGALKIQVQGEAGKTILWLCSLEWIELKT